MPIYKGSTEIKKIYAGSTEISKAYKGSTEVFSSGFDPGSYNPTAWYDITDSNTITITSGVISQIDDITGNNYHLIQPTASLGFTYSGDTVYMPKSLTKRMFNDTLAAKVYLSFTLFYVFKAASAWKNTIMNFDINSAAPHYRFMSKWDAQNNQHKMLVFIGSGTAYKSVITATNGITDAQRKSVFTNRIINSPRFHHIRVNNGVQIAQATTALAINVTQVKFGIGSLDASSPHGYLSEIIMYNYKLTDAQYLDVENYLIAKHNI